MALNLPPELIAKLLLGQQGQMPTQAPIQPAAPTMLNADPAMLLAMGAGPGKSITDTGLEIYHRNAAPFTKNPPKGTLEQKGRQLFGREVQRGPDFIGRSGNVMQGKFGGTPKVVAPSAYGIPIMQGPRPPIGGNIAPMGRIDELY